MDGVGCRGARVKISGITFPEMQITLEHSSRYDTRQNGKNLNYERSSQRFHTKLKPTRTKKTKKNTYYLRNFGVFSPAESTKIKMSTLFVRHGK